MTKPVRIQRKRTKGWRLPPNTVYVSRPSRYSNPFDWREGMDISDGNREWSKGASVDLFREWLRYGVKRFPFRPVPPSREEIVRDLRGKNLACWCRLDEPCHVDVLLKLANAPDGDFMK